MGDSYLETKRNEDLNGDLIYIQGIIFVSVAVIVRYGIVSIGQNQPRYLTQKSPSLAPIQDVNIGHFSGLTPECLDIARVRGRPMAVDQQCLHQFDLVAPFRVLWCSFSGKSADIIPDISCILVIVPEFLLQSDRKSLLASLTDVQEDVGTVDRMRAIDLIDSIVVVGVHFPVLFGAGFARRSAR